MSKLIDDKTRLKLLNRLIITSWIFLFICFIIKLFGANLFEIVYNNKTFIAVCNYIDNNYWINYIISCVCAFISNSLFILAVIQKYKFKWWQLLIVVIDVLSATAIKMWNNMYGMIFDVIGVIIISMIFIGKPCKKYWNILIGNILSIIFQVLSMFIRNIKLTFFDDNMLIGLILSIDLYIMLILYYLYSNLKGVKKMSWLFGKFFAKKITQLEESKVKNIELIERLKTEDEQKYASKIASLIEENIEIDKDIAKLKAKEQKKNESEN